MDIEILTAKENEDYAHGCLQIRARNTGEAFHLGILFKQLRYTNKEVTANLTDLKHSDPFIRIPLNPDAPWEEDE